MYLTVATGKTPRAVPVCYDFLPCRPGVILVHHREFLKYKYSTWHARYRITCTGMAFRGLNVEKVKYMHVTRYVNDTS
jgi:hypothetical protein